MRFENKCIREIGYDRIEIFFKPTHLTHETLINIDFSVTFLLQCSRTTVSEI